jgi:hypothetical protein
MLVDYQFKQLWDRQQRRYILEKSLSTGGPLRHSFGTVFRFILSCGLSNTK